MKYLVETVKSIILWWAILLVFCWVLSLFKGGSFWKELPAFAIVALFCSMLLHLFVYLSRNYGVPVIIIDDRTRHDREDQDSQNDKRGR